MSTPQLKSFANSLICGLASLVLVASTLVSPASAVHPQLSSISPVGVQRGTEVEVIFSGNECDEAVEVMFYSPGFTVQSLEKSGDNQAKAKIAVAADCRLGIHALRLRSPSGMSGIKTFTVGALGETKEVEPNNDFATPQAVSLNTTVAGSVGNEDVDYYSVDLQEGQRLSVEIEALRLGNSYFDPYVAILNAERFELSRSDDAPLLNQDALCSIVAPTTGKYIIQVRESAYGGGSAYRMHVGSFPRPTAVLPAGGKPGEKLQVKWLGDAGGEFTSEVTIPAGDETGRGELFAQDDRGIAPSPNPIRVVDLDNYLEAEPNHEIANASSAAAPGAMNGVIGEPGDVDLFKFEAKKGQAFEVRVFARMPIRSPLDSVLQILNDKGQSIANNDDSGGPDSYLRFNVPSDGVYFVSVRDHLNSGGPTYVYRVELSPVQPELIFSLPERERYVATTLTVGKGNRMAVMVSAQRQNFGGDITLEAQNLPPGMSIQLPPFTGNRNEVPVLFTAAADAAPAGALVPLTGKSTDPNVNVTGKFRQRTMLIRGNNNSDVWGHDSDRMAVVLSEEIPFKLDLVQPKAPLVRNGSIDLKVVATRAEGFTGEIRVQLLYNPPGVASSSNITIPEGQNEALIPLTANGGAAIGSWQIVALGRARDPGAMQNDQQRGRRGGGSFEVATGFIDLNITDQFYKFTFDKSAVEQGKESDVLVKVEKLADFAGNAKCELKGLPAGVTVDGPVEFNKDTTEILIKVKSAADARPGKYNSLVCVTTFPVEGELVTHTLGTGEIRVDAPLPPKPAAPMAQAAPMPMPMPAAEAPPMKRLSRLEQLRLEKEQAMGK